MTLEGLDPGRGGAEGRTLSVSMSCLLAVLFSDQVEPALCSRPLEDVGYTEVQADPETGVAQVKPVIPVDLPVKLPVDLPVKLPVDLPL